VERIPAEGLGLGDALLGQPISVVVGVAAKFDAAHAMSFPLRAVVNRH
jgi:hypothetical protein